MVDRPSPRLNANRRRRVGPRKRTPYVDRACNECKRRKVKCYGEEPCSKCVRYGTSCQYPLPPQTLSPSPVRDELSPTSVRGSTASRQNATLGIDALAPGLYGEDLLRAQGAGRTPQDQLASPASSFQTKQTQITEANFGASEFCGPSSSEFTLNMVSGNLRAMGIPVTIPDRAAAEGEGGPSDMSSRLAQYGPFMKLIVKDPLWGLNREDAAEDIDRWFQGTGVLYPVVDQAKLLQTARKVFDAMDNARSYGLRNGAALVESLFTDETNKLKLILAAGRTYRNGGRCDQAQKLLQSTLESIEGVLWNANTLNNIQLMLLMALYYYHLDEEVRTGRIIGFAARLCLEMGLHRRAVIDAFATDEERGDALRTFWCVYMLERRTSLGQGVPFSIQDSHIDPSLFRMGATDPFASALLDWTKLAGKVWEALNARGEKEVEVKTDELDFLDYQITQWYDRLPEDLKLPRPGPEQGETATHKQAVLFLRRSHLQNLIYRPVLQTASRITQYSHYALSATRIAKDSLQTLSRLNQSTPLIGRNPVFFKHLLLTAFGNLLLAVVNASSMFCDSVKVEFDIALDLIRVLSGGSPLLMDLWKRLQGLGKLRAQLVRGGSPALEVNSGSARDETGMADESSDALLFDELLPHLPLDPGLLNMMELPGDVVGMTMVRDQMNGLFDFPAARGGGPFDGPFGTNLTWD